MTSNQRYPAEYRAKLRDADSAMASVPEGALVVFGTGLAEPQALLWSLSNRLRDGALERLRVFSGPPYHHASDSICGADVAGRVERVCQFVGPTDRESIKAGAVSYLPHQFHQIPRLMREAMDIDLAVTIVSPLDETGHFTLGTNADFISAGVRCARRVVVEVNRHMPRTHGDTRLALADVDAVVENHTPLPPVERATGGPEDARIAERVAELVPDGATLQVGSGALPDMVCKALRGHRDLGIHSELLVPGLVDLIRCGAANGARKTEKPGRHVYTLLVGDPDTLALVDDNPDFECHPVEYTNRPAVIARNRRMISINAALEVDLMGQINAESLDGYQFSGAGGQLDFVRGAYDSPEGKSIVAFHSTARKGSVSRIVASFRPGTVVTTPRADTHYLITEFGSADLKGKSVAERARAIVGLAHPDFREDLNRAAREMGLV
ncbi:MAG: acetyl-CoA hydrolase/transferase family protein [Proteobacteria bacterium]|nr:acetyl-CoA hydrolase/transferase family protein [Pseudomonadota bacterium]